MNFFEGSHDGRGLKIGIVTARFNFEVTEKLEQGALAALNEMGCKDVYQVRVAGAFEIPLAAKALIDSGCDGVVALGAVIRGETSHYDYVCSSVERGCTLLQVTTGKPVAFGVLTTENEEQAMDRVGGRHGHKGIEAARVAVEMVRLLKQVHEIGIR